MVLNDMADSENPRKAADVFAESVRVERARRQWSQAEVAAKAGTTAGLVSEIEGGKVDPRLSTVERIAAALGMTVTIGAAA